MELLQITMRLALYNTFVMVSAALFVILILVFLFKFFSFFFYYMQAQGCFTVGLVVLVGMPAIIVICLIAGYNFTSTLLIIFAVVGVITGFIARDSEGNVGKFGNFIMIVSSITLIIALFLAKFLKLF